MLATIDSSLMESEFPLSSMWFLMFELRMRGYYLEGVTVLECFKLELKGSIIPATFYLAGVASSKIRGEDS